MAIHPFQQIQVEQLSGIFKRMLTKYQAAKYWLIAFGRLDRPNMTSAVYHECKATNQINKQ